MYLLTTSDLGEKLTELSPFHPPLGAGDNGWCVGSERRE